MYYNPNTHEQKDLDYVKILLNASIPFDTEQVGDWHLLHNLPISEVPEGQKVIEGPIEERDGLYYQTYLLEELTEEELAEAHAQEQAERLQQAKEQRAEAVSHITVEVDDLVFDGDEAAQDRMSRVASIASDNELDTVLPWVLADNTVANVTVAQIKEALRKALYAQAALWVVPYVNIDGDE